jgi:5'-3' exonuclease
VKQPVNKAKSSKNVLPQYVDARQRMQEIETTAMDLYCEIEDLENEMDKLNLEYYDLTGEGLNQ